MEKIKKFLKKWIVNNIGYKILAVVFAFVLWLVIMNATDPTLTRTITGIPVIIENEECVVDGTRVYTIESGETATIVVSGNRSIVSTLTASDFVAKANFEELSITNAVPIKIEVSPENQKYVGGITISQKTTSMIIKLEDVSEKTFDVQVEFTGTEPDNLVIDDAVCNPAIVTLTAPISVLEATASAVVRIPYNDVKENCIIREDVFLVDETGEMILPDENSELSANTVSVNITTSGLKQVPVSIVPLGTVAQNATFEGLSYSKNKITLKGDPAILEGIESIELPSDLLSIDGKASDVTVTINIADYLPQGTSVYGDTGTITITAVITKKQ